MFQKILCALGFHSPDEATFESFDRMMRQGINTRRVAMRCKHCRRWF